MPTQKALLADGKNNLNALVIGDGAFSQDMSGCWVEDESLEGVQPLFDIKCQFHPDIPMMMRYSHITPKSLRVSQLTGRKLIIEYKCKKCGLTEHFYVDEPEEYLEKIRTKRIIQGYKDLYYPHDKWVKDGEIKKRLESLGYF